MLEDPVITGIAGRVGASPAQVIIRWHMSHGLIPLVKTENFGRLKENIDSAQVNLTEEDIAAINNLDKGARFFQPANWPHWSPLKYFPYFD